MLPFELVSEKIKENSSTSRNKVFLIIGLPLMVIMVSKKI